MTDINLYTGLPQDESGNKPFLQMGNQFQTTGIHSSLYTPVDFNVMMWPQNAFTQAMASGSPVGTIPNPLVGYNIRLPDGSVTSPALSWATESNSGLYKIGSNDFGQSVNGVLAYDWNATRLKLASGYSLDITDMTNGSILFAGNSTGRVSQDNTNLFWNASSHILKLGTAAVLQLGPTHPVFPNSVEELVSISDTFNGPLRFAIQNTSNGGSAHSTISTLSDEGNDSSFGIANSGWSGGTLSAGEAFWIMNTGAGFGPGGRGMYLLNALSSYLRFGTSGSERMRILAGGQVLINTTTAIASEQLRVNGDIYTDTNYLWRSGTAFTGTFDHAITAIRTWTFPDATGTVMLTSTGSGLFTQGSIPFADAAGLLTQNNASLFWDNANNILRLGALCGVEWTNSTGYTYFSLHNAQTTFNGTVDNTMHWAYNVTPGTAATRIDTSKPSLKVSIEADFNNAVKRLMEFNCDFLSSDGLTSRRGFTYGVNQAAPYDQTWAFNGTKIQFFEDTGTTAYGQFLAGGLTLGPAQPTSLPATNQLYLSSTSSDTSPIGGRGGEVVLFNNVNTDNTYFLIQHTSPLNSIASGISFVNSTAASSYGAIRFHGRSALGYISRLELNESSTVGNTSQANYDFVLKGMGDANLLSVDANALTNVGAVGIGVAVPLRKLHVVSAAPLRLATSGGEGVEFVQQSTTDWSLSVIGSTTTSISFIPNGGGIGANTITPRRTLDVSKTVTQFRLTYTDNSVFTDFFSDSSGNLTISPTGTKVGIQAGANGQKIDIEELTELTTIAAAATTDTAIQIPLDAVVFAVSTRVKTVIPTAATFTVTGTTSGTQFDVAGGVSTAANTTDIGTANCTYKNGAAQTIRITPNLVPGAATGQVRVTIHFYRVTPATS